MRCIAQIWNSQRLHLNATGFDPRVQRGQGFPIPDVLLRVSEPPHPCHPALVVLVVVDKETVEFTLEIFLYQFVFGESRQAHQLQQEVLWGEAAQFYVL